MVARINTRAQTRARHTQQTNAKGTSDLVQTKSHNAGQTRFHGKFRKNTKFGKKSGKNTDDFAGAPSEVPG